MADGVTREHGSSIGWARCGLYTTGNLWYLSGYSLYLAKLDSAFSCGSGVQRYLRRTPRYMRLSTTAAWGQWKQAMHPPAEDIIRPEA